MAKKIRIRVYKKDATLEVKPIGYAGKDCLSATQAIEERLGMDPANRKYTADINKKSEKHSRTQSRAQAR